LNASQKAGILVTLACHNVLVKASLKGRFEAVFELAEEKELGMV